jgi:hypothetical protein
LAENEENERALPLETEIERISVKATTARERWALPGDGTGIPPTPLFCLGKNIKKKLFRCLAAINGRLLHYINRNNKKTETRCSAYKFKRQAFAAGIHDIRRRAVS